MRRDKEFGDVPSDEEDVAESGEGVRSPVEPYDGLSPAAPDANDGGEGFPGTDALSLAALATIIADIKETSHRRQTLHKAEKSLTLQISSQERGAANQRLRSEGKEPPEKGDTKVIDADKACVKETYPELFVARANIKGSRRDSKNRVSFGRFREEKRLEHLVMFLPAAVWWCSIPGLAPLGLGQIVGIAGDLSKYAGPYKLTKQLGIAPPKTYELSKKALKKGQEKHKVPRQRLSTVLMIVDSLLRNNFEDTERTRPGKYRALYLEEKRRQVALNPEFDKGFDPETATGASKHCDRKAKRVVAKQLTIDLWNAWREATPFLTPSAGVPLAAE